MKLTVPNGTHHFEYLNRRVGCIEAKVDRCPGAVRAVPKATVEELLTDGGKGKEELCAEDTTGF